MAPSISQPASADLQSPGAGTDAFGKFTQNIAKLDALSRLAGYGLEALFRQRARLEQDVWDMGRRLDRLRWELESLEADQQSLRNDLEGEDAARKERLALSEELTREDAAQEELRDAAVARFEELKRETAMQEELRRELPIPLVVAHTEAYVHDVLCELAAADPSVMNETTQAAKYSEIVRFASIGELTTELRSRWARNWIDGSGPARWIDRLTKWGARSYGLKTAPTMETGWGVRHVLIHRAGVASRDFVDRHSDFSAVPGKPLAIPDEFAGQLRSAVLDFVAVTDRHVLARIANAQT